jgi:hypothetical protein
MNRRCLIASPGKSNLGLHYITLFEALIRKGVPGWTFEYLVEGANSALNVARNLLAHDAIKKGFDRMLMLDTDHPATLEHVTRILSHDHEEVPIVSGLYCMKRPGRPFFLGIKAKGAKPDSRGLLRADFLPTGFLSVSVAALRKIAETHPEREFYVQDDVLTPAPRPTRETMFEFFPIGVKGPRTAEARLRKIKAILRPGRAIPMEKMGETLMGVINIMSAAQPPGNLLGEDYYFGRLATESGIPMYLDVNCLVPHIGGISYPLTDPSLIATGCDEIPEADAAMQEW